MLGHADRGFRQCDRRGARGAGKTWIWFYGVL